MEWLTYLQKYQNMYQNISFPNFPKISKSMKHPSSLEDTSGLDHNINHNNSVNHRVSFL